MGSISVNKLGGLALVSAPIITLILYFLQPGGIIVDTADPANALASITAIVTNAGLGKILSVLIPIGLLVWLYGVLVLQSSIKGKGNGDALSRLGALFLVMGIIGWTISSGASLAIAGSGLPAQHAATAFGSLYSMTIGIGTVAGIFSGIGVLLIALALSTREDFNKMFAMVAALAAAVAVITCILGGLNTSQLQTMNNIGGITYLIHMVWFFMLGLNLMKGEQA